MAFLGIFYCTIYFVGGRHLICQGPLYIMKHQVKWRGIAAAAWGAFQALPLDTFELRMWL